MEKRKLSRSPKGATVIPVNKRLQGHQPTRYDTPESIAQNSICGIVRRKQISKETEMNYAEKIRAHYDFVKRKQEGWTLYLKAFEKGNYTECDKLCALYKLNTSSSDFCSRLDEDEKVLWHRRLVERDIRNLKAIAPYLKNRSQTQYPKRR